MNNKIVTIITHDGQFHPDEVFASAVIKCVYPNSQINIVRTRDRSKIDKVYYENEICYILDVGNEYEPDGLKFDHHQWSIEDRMVRDNGIPYATFGLVFKAYGMDIIKNLSCYFAGINNANKRENFENLVYRAVDKKIVSIIDAADNGYMIDGKISSSMGIGDIISIFNPIIDFGFGIDGDNEFNDAVNIAKKIFMNTIIHKINDILGEVSLQEAIDEQLKEKSDEILILNKSIKFNKIIFSEKNKEKTKNLKYIICPNSKFTEWSAIAVPLNANTKELRNPFPDKWRTLRDKKLEAVCNVEGAIFCHATGFISIFRTVESAIKACELSLLNGVDNGSKSI